ncbi:MAG: ATP-dependent dethiobiotin synthetase BioD [Candidatus Homeothermus sp.]|nr:ATP-dependent dethiobiotin synthetase BioD [Candidatus Homeothermus sp.]
MSDIIFISGIDTDAGKTYATAWLAKHLMKKGQRVITQKFIQTGNSGYSEDIVKHRELMGTGLLPEDEDFTTAPIIFSYPASAQLAARLDGKEINLDKVRQSSAVLASHYDSVLVEGAGGLMVPVTDDYFTIDYVKDEKLPLALVTNGVLGSINHTILSLEAIKNRDITLRYLLYNTYFDNDKTIADDTRGFINRYLAKHFPESEMLVF